MKSFCILLLVLSVSCVRLKSEMNVSFIMQPDEMKILESHCTEMNSNGDMIQLIKDVKRETEEALSIMENLGSGARARLSEISESVALKSTRIKSLANPEWTKERWSHEINWQINLDDLHGNARETFFIEANVTDVFFMGQSNSQLLKQIAAEVEEDAVMIKYRGIGSSLELCQLQKTLIIMANIRTKNLSRVKNNYFSLFVR